MRYSRQQLAIGKEAQEELVKKTATIVGVGGLGCSVSNLLARAGVNLILIDEDKVDETNMQRQILYTEQDIGKPKVEAAKKHLQEINSTIKIQIHQENLNSHNINLLESDIIMDCTDNLETRFILNTYSKKRKIPMVYGGAIKDKGTIMNILTEGPCLRCVMQEFEGNPTSITEGILGTIVTLVASIQSNEAIKILTNKEPEKDMLRIDLSNNKFLKIKVKKSKTCPICNND